MTNPTGTDGASQIAQKRFRQIFQHGYTVAGDAEQNPDGELLRAAVAMLIGTELGDMPGLETAQFEEVWPWGESAWVALVYGKSDLDTLVLAGAMIAAEIDRINATEEKS